MWKNLKKIKHTLAWASILLYDTQDIHSMVRNYYVLLDSIICFTLYYYTSKYFLLFILKNGVVDGKEIGSIESKLLCRSILDLYIGEDPFDRRAKDDVDLNVASLLQQK